MSVAGSIGFAPLFLAVAAGAFAQAPASPAAQPPAKPAFEAKAIVLEPVHAVVLPMQGSTCSTRTRSRSWAPSCPARA